MDEESENFCLKWDEFEQNIIGAFKDLRKEKDFYDVTLVCGEKQVQAHRVVLAACSPTFREMIRSSPHHHPVLYMRGIRHTDLVAMLDFMYHGEVMIATEELETFLATAQDLSVRGLTQSGDDTEPPNAEEALNDDVENLLRRLEGGEPPEKVRKLNVKKEPGASSELSLPASITKVRIKQEPSSKLSKPNPPTPPVVLERVAEPPQPNVENNFYNNFQPSSATPPQAPPSSQNYPGLNISTITEQQPPQPRPTPPISKQTYPTLDIAAARSMAGINVSTVVEKPTQLPSQSLSVSQPPAAPNVHANYANNSSSPSPQPFRNSNTPTVSSQSYTLNTAQASSFQNSSSTTQQPSILAAAVSGSSILNQNYSNMNSANVTSRALAYLTSQKQIATSTASPPVSYSPQNMTQNSNPVLKALTASSSATLAASIAALGAPNPSQPASHIATRGRTSMDDIMAKAIDIAQLGTFNLPNNAMTTTPAPTAMMSPSLMAARTAQTAQSGARTSQVAQSGARTAQTQSRVPQQPPTEMFNPRPTYTLAYDQNQVPTRPPSETDSQGSESEGQTDPESYIERVQTPDGQGLLRCKVCQKMGSSKGKAQLIAHVESVHLNNSVQCNVCNKHFKAKSYLNKHLKRGKCCNAVINSISGMF